MGTTQRIRNAFVGVTKAFGDGGRYGKGMGEREQERRERVWGKGERWGMGNPTPRTNKENQSCFCCGKNNHLKAERRYKEKACNRCGLVGHLEAVCRAGNTTTNSKPGGAGSTKTGLQEGTGGVHWTCHKCYGEHLDTKLQKCPVESCRAKRLQDEPDKVGKELIGKEALKILEEGQVDTEENKKLKEELKS